MNKMVERVAQAMMDSDYSEDGAPVNIHFGILAKAAISAMREPTEEMIEAGWNASGDQPQTHWTAMINEALK